MEDNPMMTIEFLRARLLTERSVSRAARQRAAELAKRVGELEEQLNIVCIQRKKAEKATEDLLEILENHGISDASDYESSSDQEQEEDSSVNSSVRRNDTDMYSGSELESTAGAGKSLSWKGRKNNPHSLERYKHSLRRGSSFASSGSSSSKHRQGKSCRQIRRKELRSFNQETKSLSMRANDHENVIAVSSEALGNSCDAGSDNMGERLIKTTKGSESVHLRDQRKAATAEHNIDSRERDKEMKEALEHQAQLIHQYETMEKAQREWEKKFRQNENTNQDSYDPGNQSDITEERDDCKEQFPQHSDTIFSQGHKEKSEVEGVCLRNEQSNMRADDYLLPSKDAMNHLQDKKSSRTLVTNPSMQENCERNLLLSTSHNLNSHLPSCGSPGRQLTNILSSPLGNSSPKPCGPKNELCALVPHDKLSDLGGVLDSLKQAKLSLQQKITKLEKREGGPVGSDMRVFEPSIPAARPWERSDVPVGCAGLFRIPTEFPVTKTQANFLVSSSGSSLTNYHPDTEATTGANDRLVMETRSRFSGEDQLLGNEFTNSKHTIPSLKPYLNTYLDISLPSSGKDVNPSYPSAPDLMPQMPSTEQLSSRPIDREARMHPADHFLISGNRVSLKSYRW